MDGFQDSYRSDSSSSEAVLVLGQEPVHLCSECRDLMYDVLAEHREYAARVPVPTPKPDWQRAMEWLDAQCGGRAAVLALDDAPLGGPRPEPPTGLTGERIEQLRSILGILEAAARRFFDAEIRVALERAVILVVQQRPGVLLDQRAAVSAHGVIWAVARANGLMHPAGVVSDRSLREFLDSGQSGATAGRKVQVAVRSVFDWSDPSQEMDAWRWPINRVSLEPLGQPGLLVARVRRRLIEVRERALREAAITADVA